MKVYLSKYRNHWLSPYVILKRVLFWVDEDKIYNVKDEPNNRYEILVKILNPICVGIQKILDFIHPRVTYVKIDHWDTWSMDDTLSVIILPMLKQLRDTKNGYPLVADEDAPEYMRSHMAQPKENEWAWDDLAGKRWDYVLDEMIWAFEQMVAEDAEGQFFDRSQCNDKLPWEPDYIPAKWDKENHYKWQERKSNGLRLFGKYYENLWD